LLKEGVLEESKNVAKPILASLIDAPRRAAQAARKQQESSSGRRINDISPGSLSGFIAYVQSKYNACWELRAPSAAARSQAASRWRMIPLEKPQSGAEARKFAQRGSTDFPTKMIKGLQRTSRYADWPGADRDIPLGLNGKRAAH